MLRARHSYRQRTDPGDRVPVEPQVEPARRLRPPGDSAGKSVDPWRLRRRGRRVDGLVDLCFHCHDIGQRWRKGHSPLTYPRITHLTRFLESTSMRDSLRRLDMRVPPLDSNLLRTPCRMSGGVPGAATSSSSPNTSMFSSALRLPRPGLDWLAALAGASVTAASLVTGGGRGGDTDLGLRRDDANRFMRTDAKPTLAALITLLLREHGHRTARR